MEELNVERINIVSQEGKVRLVITCAERAPDPVVNGQAFTRQGRSPGLIFYNADGDECGGLVFGGGRNGDRHTASSGLFLDQFLQDQVVGLAYDDEDGRRSYGLRIWERPTAPVTSPEGQGGVGRAFVGRTSDGEAAVILRDRQGRRRPSSRPGRCPPRRSGPRPAPGAGSGSFPGS